MKRKFLKIVNKALQVDDLKEINEICMLVFCKNKCSFSMADVIFEFWSSRFLSEQILQNNHACAIVSKFYMIPNKLVFIAIST